jgi:hypothetical protein
MNQADLPSNQFSRCREIRIKSIPLEVELRKTRPFNLGKFHLCTFIDINLGGVGMYSDTLVLGVLDKVDMRVHHNNRNYYVRGIVGYRQETNGGVQYGIIFVEVPGELDMLITKAMDNEQTQDNNIPLHLDKGTDTNLIPGGQRRVDVRRTTPQVSIKVRKSDTLSLSRYYEADMVDISRQGIGFVSDAFQCELMGEVDLALVIKGHSHTARGIICFNAKTMDGYRYGARFEQLEPGLEALLKP